MKQENQEEEEEEEEEFAFIFYYFLSCGLITRPTRVDCSRFCCFCCLNREIKFLNKREHTKNTKKK